MSTNAKLSIAFILLLICGISYYAYSSHREKKIEAFRSFVMGDRGKNSFLRCLKQLELGLSQSDATAVIIEVQAERDFDNSK